MDGGLTITLISVAMFLGCFFLGFIPLLFSLSSLKFISILGAGLLCGTALAITIPEGVDLKTACLSNSAGLTATLGLTIHAAADGFALGAAVATAKVTVQVIIFLAVILHKAPASFGLVSYLMHTGLEKKYIQGHLLAFSAAAPIVAITTYFILHALFCDPNRTTGIGMLFSGGTFLYVATVHVLPEISSTSSSAGEADTLQPHPEGHVHQQRFMGLLESLTLIFGMGLPVILHIL
uniref:Zinc transporter ZIP9 n=1 Tax=Neogobius melanostomus TaxID=47308 RepID=A0A8C6S430_9GOBI